MTRRGERGLATAVEAVLIIPALALFVGLVFVLARDALAEQGVGAAASQAARAASLERTVSEARRSAELTATVALREGGPGCREQSVSVDAAGLLAPIGSPARVSVTVSCTVEHELTLPGFPRSRTITETRQSPVDTYRGR